MVHEIVVPMSAGNPENTQTVWVYYPPGEYEGLYYPQGYYLAQATRPEDARGIFSYAPLPCMVGDIIRAYARFSYRGPKLENIILHGAAGTQDLGGYTFHEGHPYSERSISQIGPDDDWREYTDFYVDIVIPENTGYPFYIPLSGRDDVGLYVKIKGPDVPKPDVDKTMSPYYWWALDVAPREVDFRDMKITDYAKVG